MSARNDSTADNEIETIRKILKESKTVAVVGLSRSPEKDSYSVAQHLMQNGFRVVPVNPASDSILGEKSYPDLKSIPFRVDIVDVFRPSKDVPGIIDDAIRTEVPVIWLQHGIFATEEDAGKVSGAGRTLIQDRCIAVMYSLYGRT